MANQEKTYVSFAVFTWAIGIIIGVIGWMLVANSSLAAKVDSISDSYVLIQTQLSQIQTDLRWVRNSVEKQ